MECQKSKVRGEIISSTIHYSNFAFLYYFQPNRADVAIFKLAKKTNASVITINNDPSIPKLLNDDENMTAYGMGLISNNQGTDSQVLLQVKEKYIEDCTPYLGIFFNDTAMICVNGTQATVDLNGNVIGSGVCQGDSGGPLVYDLNLSSMILPVQVGISSFISNRERCGDAR